MTPRINGLLRFPLRALFAATFTVALILCVALAPIRRWLTPAAPGSQYVIEPPDLIEISFDREPALGESLAVQPDGRIVVGALGPLMAAGKTQGQLQAAIEQAAGRHGLAQGVRVVVKPRSKVYYVVQNIGETTRISRFHHTGRETALSAITTLSARAGGQTRDGETVRIVRPARDGTHQVEEIPVRLKHASRYELQPGDRLVITSPDDEKQTRAY